jgi:ABC-type transporter Mla subunit MlaD
MPEGFAHDPASIRAFGDVFAEASAQVERVRATLGNTSARAADFGDSWRAHGEDFERYFAALTEDLANLRRQLSAVGAQLAEGTDLVVETDAGSGGE